MHPAFVRGARPLALREYCGRASKSWVRANDARCLRRNVPDPVSDRFAANTNLPFPMGEYVSKLGQTLFLRIAASPNRRRVDERI
jgi:hypothetical protein